MGVMLFNGFGYRMVSNYFDQKASDRLIELIDQNQFNEAELISPSKHPSIYLIMPTILDSKEWMEKC